VLLGHHYFVTTPGGTGVSPTFDFRADSEKGNPNAFVISAKAGDILAPQDPKTNVDWLELKAIAGQGALAKYVFRILTIGGQPPASVRSFTCPIQCHFVWLEIPLQCTPGSAPIAVPYAANYCAFL
jgi:hypothetical protein